MVHTIKKCKSFNLKGCKHSKVAYANVSNPQISCARTASVLE